MSSPTQCSCSCWTLNADSVCNACKRALGPGEPPRPTGKVGDVRFGDLTGRVFPWTGRGPFFMHVADAEALYLPIFRDAEALRALLDRACPDQPYTVKQIDDGPEFVDSIPRQLDGAPVVLILDPHFTERGTVKYTELRWN